MTDTKTAPVGCCGHDCTRCKTYLATLHEDADLRQQSMQFYHDTFSVDLPSEEFVCHGCRSESVFALCRDCPFTACADRHRIMHCVECAEYPCAMLADYQEKYLNRCNQISP